MARVAAVLVLVGLLVGAAGCAVEVPGRPAAPPDPCQALLSAGEVERETGIPPVEVECFSATTSRFRLGGPHGPELALELFRVDPTVAQRVWAQTAGQVPGGVELVDGLGDRAHFGRTELHGGAQLFVLSGRLGVLLSLSPVQVPDRAVRGDPRAVLVALARRVLARAGAVR